MIDYAKLSDEQRIKRYTRLARLALSHYGLADASLLHKSYTENVVFEVKDAASRTHASLRICRPTWDVAALTRETAWLKSLAHATNLRVPVPILTQSGEPYCVVEETGIPGARACILLTWVSGDYARPAELTVARVHGAGQFLATLHNHSAEGICEIDWEGDRADAESLSQGDCLSNVSTYFTSKRALAAFDRAIEATVDLMRELGDGLAVAGIIHGDFHQRNYIFDGSEIGALDFETIRWGYYLYDLASTLSYLVPEFLGDVDPALLGNALLDGYAGRRRLPTGFERMLTIFSAYRVWIMADWLSGSPRMLEHDWARRRLDAMPEQIQDLLASV